MTRWTEEEARAYGFRRDKDGNWSKETRTGGKSSNPKEVPEPKQPVCNNSPGKTKDKKRMQRSYDISIIQYTTRATDPDNLCPKIFIDEIVKRKYLPDDSSKYVNRVTKEVVKVKKPKEERTEIEIWENVNDN